MTTRENYSSIFGVNVSNMSTSQGGVTMFGITGSVVEDSAFNQMMQLMIGFCRNSNCSSDSVKKFDTDSNFQIMCSVFTIMCPGGNLELSHEELHYYGVEIKHSCPGFGVCTNSHDQKDLRRRLFLNNGQCAYWPVLCAHVSGGRQIQQHDQKLTICPQGDFCQSAHNLKEILYHPLTFKTTPCQIDHE